MADDITIRFACQHPTLTVQSDADLSDVQCVECGERRVQRVKVPPPRITARECDASRDMGPLVIHG